MHRLVLTILATVTLAATSVAGESPRTIGILTCTLKERTKDSPENMMCGFARAAGAAHEEKYVADVRGLSLPAVGKQVLVWTVSARSTTKPAAGFLAQEYTRLKVPGHAPAWVGQRNSTIALQFESHGSAELGSSIATIVLKIATTSA